MSVLRGRGQVLDGDTGLAPVSAHELLAGTTGDRTVVPVVHVSPEMVADLHEPRLVISPEYVGRDRRQGPVRWVPSAPDRRSGRRWAQAVVVALVTTVAVVPLTLMVAHGVPAATDRGGAATGLLVHPVANRPTRPTRPTRAASATASARAAARQARSVERAAAHSARAAAVADQRAARSALASTRAEQRSAVRAARAIRRAEARAVRAAKTGSRLKTEGR